MVKHLFVVQIFFSGLSFYLSLLCFHLHLSCLLILSVEVVELPFLNLLSSCVICAGSMFLVVRAEIPGSGCTSGEVLGDFKVLGVGGEFFPNLRFTIGNRENGVYKSKENMLRGTAVASVASTSVKHVYAQLIWGITRNIEVLFLNF